MAGRQRASSRSNIEAPCLPGAPIEASMNNSHDDPIAVIGGGPAGLTAAYWLTGRGRKAVVFEADTQVGGISRTVEYRGSGSISAGTGSSPRSRRSTSSGI